MPTVSVVIPTYDRADVLPRAVDSVLSQTFADLELVVVDDGSTDGTEAYLESIDDERLRPVFHETNEGANVARNTGIEEANGDYVAFLDSDDEWAPTKLERQVAAVENDDAAVAVYCAFETTVSGVAGRGISAVAAVLAVADDDRPMAGGEELIGEILADYLHSGAGSTLLVETDVARAVGGFDEELDRFQDPEFLLRVVQEGRLAYVDAPLVTRYETPVPDAATIESAAEAFLAKHADLVDRAEAEGYDVAGAHALLLAKHFLREGKFRRGAAYLREARLPARHVPGVSWSAASGLRRRTNGRFAPAVGVVGLAVLVGVVWLVAGSKPSA